MGRPRRGAVLTRLNAYRRGRYRCGGCTIINSWGLRLSRDGTGVLGLQGRSRLGAVSRLLPRRAVREAGAGGWGGTAMRCLHALETRRAGVVVTMDTKVRPDSLQCTAVARCVVYGAHTTACFQTLVIQNISLHCQTAIALPSNPLKAPSSSFRALSCSIPSQFSPPSPEFFRNPRHAVHGRPPVSPPPFPLPFPVPLGPPLRPVSSGATT